MVKDLGQISIDKKGNIRFEVGFKSCQNCGTKNNVIQFERKTKHKGLPIIEIAFICENCAKKEKLISEDFLWKSEDIDSEL